MNNEIMAVEQISDLILTIRNQQVILDSDLARLYGVKTKRLNEQVKRNTQRFPKDFIFELTQDERNELVANCDRFKNLKHSSALPKAFTEHGVIMAANVLSSDAAIEMSVFIVRAFVRLRQMLSANNELALLVKKLDLQVEKHQTTLSTHSQAINEILAVIQQIISEPEKKKKQIGFKPPDNK